MSWVVQVVLPISFEDKKGMEEFKKRSFIHQVYIDCHFL